jgi:ABC-type lipoprotein release transport system permease subunit
VPVLLRIAWRNLLRGWRRTAVVLSAISVGLAGCLAVVGWTRGMVHQMAETAIRTQLAHVAVHARGYHRDPDVQRAIEAPGSVIELLRDRPGVHASPRLAGEGLIQSARANLRASVVGIVPREEAQVSLVASAVIDGTYLPAEPGPRPARALPPVVIGRAAAERLSVGVGDKVVLHVPGDDGLGAFRVRGLYRTASSDFDRAFVFIPLADAQRLYGVGDRVTEIAVALERPAETAALQAWLRERLAARGGGDGLEVLQWREREPRLAAILDWTRDVGWIFYAVVFVAMIFGIANALLMAVYERVREFGVLRALGLQARRLVALVMLESLLLTLWGTALGLAIGWGLVLWVGEVGLDLSRFSEGLRQFGVGTTIYPRLEWEDAVSPALLAATTAFIAALWPAWKTARLRPAEALRRT